MAETAKRADLTLVEQPSTPVVSATEGLLSKILAAASDPSVDLDRMDRLMAMYERLEKEQARCAYTAALSAMQPELPVIGRRGNIVITEKGNPNKIIQTTPYALWEDINEGIRPSLQKYGFALSFRTSKTAEGRIVVTGILGHKDGHSESTEVELLQDSSGSKNAVQAVGSSISYGKRYAAGLLLNITSRGEDDDGHEAGRPVSEPKITQEQADRLRDLIVSFDRDPGRFCKHLKYERLEDIPATGFDRAVEAVEAAGHKNTGARR